MLEVISISCINRDIYILIDVYSHGGPSQKNVERTNSCLVMVTKYFSKFLLKKNKVFTTSRIKKNDLA